MGDDLAPYADDAIEGPSLARKFLFRDASSSLTAAQTIGWWEKRRLPFNLAVGAAGLGTLTAVNIIGLIGPDGHPFLPPAIAIAVYAVLANVMYTGGWAAEVALRPLFGRRTPVVGATIFRYGLAFSLVLTLLPIPVAAIDFAFRVLRWVVG